MMSIQPVAHSVMSIQPVAHSVAIVSSILAVVTFLFRRVVAAAPLPVVEMPALWKTFPTCSTKSAFFDEEQKMYFRFDTTGRKLEVRKLFRIEYASQVAREISGQVQFNSRLVEDAMKMATDLCKKAEQAFVFDQPLFYHQARSTARQVLEKKVYMDPLPRNKNKQLQSLHHDLMLAEARACQKAAQQTKDVQLKLNFLFAGIRALHLEHIKLSKNSLRNGLLPWPWLLRIWFDFDHSEHHELGDQLWGQVASILEPLPDDFVLDWGVFADIIRSGRSDFLSPKHAAAFCYYNRGLMLSEIQAATLSWQGKEADWAKLRLLNKIELSFSLAIQLLTNEVKLSPYSSLEQQASFLAERVDVGSRRSVAIDPLTDGEKAMELFEAAAKETNDPLRCWAQIVLLSRQMRRIAAGFDISSKRTSLDYHKLANAYVRKIKNKYPEMDDWKIPDFIVEEITDEMKKADGMIKQARRDRKRSKYLKVPLSCT